MKTAPVEGNDKKIRRGGRVPGENRRSKKHRSWVKSTRPDEGSGDDAAHEGQAIQKVVDVRRRGRLRDVAQPGKPGRVQRGIVDQQSIEAAELLEHFQWLTPEESGRMEPESRAAVALEMADVLIYLTRLADRLGIDMLAAASEKMGLNAKKYPPLPKG